MNRAIVLIGIGGLLGSVSRYLVAGFFTRMFPAAFPYGTFIVNITGCFLIGIFYGLSQRYSWFTPAWTVFLTTGFCGGYTTFSSFAYEQISLLEASAYGTFILYSTISLVTGLLAVLGGLTLVKTFTS